MHSRTSSRERLVNHSEPPVGLSRAADASGIPPVVGLPTAMSHPFVCDGASGVKNLLCQAVAAALCSLALWLKEACEDGLGTLLRFVLCGDASRRRQLAHGSGSVPPPGVGPFGQAWFGFGYALAVRGFVFVSHVEHPHLTPIL